jgi:hypothetical protein
MRRVVGYLAEGERRVLVGAQAAVRVVGDPPAPPEHAHVEVEDRTRVATGEHDGHERDDAEHHEGDPEEEQQDVVRDDGQRLDQPKPAAEPPLEGGIDPDGIGGWIAGRGHCEPPRKTQDRQFHPGARAAGGPGSLVPVLGGPRATARVLTRAVNDVAQRRTGCAQARAGSVTRMAGAARPPPGSRLQPCSAHAPSRKRRGWGRLHDGPARCMRAPSPARASTDAGSPRTTTPVKAGTSHVSRPAHHRHPLRLTAHLWPARYSLSSSADVSP